MKTLNKAIFIILLLTGCSSGESPSNLIISSTQNITPQPLFNETPIKLIDAVSYYSHACNDPSFQFLVPTKINNDNYIDFIAHFWCDSTTPSSFDDQPTRDALVAYLSDGYGGYSIDNMGVFGLVDAKLGGASRKYSRGDINNDGYDDIVLLQNAGSGGEAINTRAEPIIYLNDRDNHLVRLDLNGIPLIDKSEDYLVHGFLADMNSDGIEDLVYFRASRGYISSDTLDASQQNFIRVYWGIKNLKL